MCVRAPWILLGLTLLTGGMYLAGGMPAVVLHPLLGLLSHGTSAGKIYFLLGYLGAFSLLWGWRSAQLPTKVPLTATTRSPRLFAAAVAVGAAAGLASFAAYTSSMGLAWSETSLHWEMGFNSSNSLTHMHTTKAALAMGIELLGWSGLHDKFDTGVAYLPCVPRWVCIAIGGAFLAACTASLWMGPRFAAECLARGDWASGAILALALGSVSKCLLDGGPLSYDFIAGLLAAMYFAHDQAKHRAWLARRWPWILMALSAWVATIGVLSPDAVDYQVMQCVRRLSLYGLISLVGARAMFTFDRGKLAAACICVLVTAHSAYGALRSRVLPLFEPVPGRVVSYEAGTQPEPLHPSDSAYHAYARLHERPHRVLWTSMLAGTSPVATGFFADIKVIDGRSVQPAAGRDGCITVSTATDEAAQRAGRTHLKVMFSGPEAPVLFRDAPNSQLDENERFVAFRLLDRLLRAQGISRYVLIPYDSIRERGRSVALASACACCDSPGPH